MPADIKCLAFPEIIAEKIRACYQRDKARDLYDLGLFANKPLDQPLIFDPPDCGPKIMASQRWFRPRSPVEKFSYSKAYDWDDLNQLVRRTALVDGNKIAADCAKGCRFLLEMTEDERQLANDPYQRKRVIWEKLRAEVLE